MGVKRTGKLLSLINGDSLEAALGHLGDPEAAVRLGAVGQARRTLVSVGFAILTLPEDAAVLGVLEGAPQPGAVGAGDGGLQLGPGAALHQVQLLALLHLVLFPLVINEGQAIAAGPQLCQTLDTGPVLVTTVSVREVSLEFIWTLEVILRVVSVI